MEAQQFHRIAKALADPRRLEILEIIVKQGEIHCGGIWKQLSVSQPTVSHHLKELFNANLVEVRTEGQNKCYRVNAKMVEDYMHELQFRLFSLR